MLSGTVFPVLGLLILFVLFVLFLSCSPLLSLSLLFLSYSHPHPICTPLAPWPCLFTDQVQSKLFKMHLAIFSIISTENKQINKNLPLNHKNKKLYFFLWLNNTMHKCVSISVLKLNTWDRLLKKQGKCVKLIVLQVQECGCWCDLILLRTVNAMVDDNGGSMCQSKWSMSGTQTRQK